MRTKRPLTNIPGAGKVMLRIAISFPTELRFGPPKGTVSSKSPSGIGNGNGAGTGAGSGDGCGMTGLDDATATAGVTGESGSTGVRSSFAEDFIDCIRVERPVRTDEGCCEVDFIEGEQDGT